MVPYHRDTAAIEQISPMANPFTQTLAGKLLFSSIIQTLVLCLQLFLANIPGKMQNLVF
jgi:hypothetical protein